MAPPTMASAVVSPAITMTPPPSPESPIPTRSQIFPAALPEDESLPLLQLASPEYRETQPEAPSLAVPVSTLILPEVPLAPPSGVATSSRPEVVTVDDPATSPR